MKFEQMQPPAPKQQMEIEQDFNDRMKGYERMIADIEATFEKADLRKYAQTEASTKTGRQILLDIYVWNKSDLSTYKQMMIENELAIVAKDKETNRVIGLRHMQIGTTYSEQEEDLRASGDINVGLRGEGIASIIDRALEKTLSQIAADKQRPIIWEVGNDNARELDSLTRERASVTDEETKQSLDTQIASKASEQERWMHLYGTEGVLGFATATRGGMDFEKTIEQNPNALPAPETVTLEQFKELKNDTSVR